MHGGDIYRNNIHFDYSVNLNPLGLPQEVQWVLTEAALHATKYPDLLHKSLIGDIAKIFGVYEDNIVFGNGASEIIMAICHAFRPKKALVLAPSFSGYETCLKGGVEDCKICYHYLLEEDGFVLKSDILDVLMDTKPDLFFLTNPNNPNGLLLEKGFLLDIIQQCQNLGTKLIIDECFITLTGMDKELSLAYSVSNYSGLVVLRAFTKSFAIPGVRLGYCLCSTPEIASTIKAHLPEWNISIFAQMAGAECLKHLDYIADGAKTINAERKYLMEELKNLGLKVYDSDANYILFKCDKGNLMEELIPYSILIRDCSDYEGLKEGFYRIAVKNHHENEGLISALNDIIKG